MLEKRLEYSERVSQRGHAEESLGNKIKVNNEVNLSDEKWIGSRMDNYLLNLYLNGF